MKPHSFCVNFFIYFTNILWNFSVSHYLPYQRNDICSLGYQFI